MYILTLTDRFFAQLIDRQGGALLVYNRCAALLEDTQLDRLCLSNVLYR